MTTLSRVIEQRLLIGQEVAWVARREAAEVAHQIALNVPYYAIKGADQLLVLIEDQARLLNAANEDLQATHTRYQQMVSGLYSGWAHQGQAAVALERVIWHAQGRIAEYLGPDMLRLYGLEEHPPSGFRALATYAHNAITLLRAHPQTLLGPLGDVLETEHIAQLIEQPVLALNDFLLRFDDAPDSFKEMLQERDMALDRWMRVWRGVATVLEGIFLLANRDDLALSVRPFLSALHQDEPDHNTTQIGMRLGSE